jgi:hypothetical protein
MRIAGFHGTYYLSDGSSWPSGAGTADQAFMTLDHFTREGSVIRYHMTTPDLIVRRTDGSFGDHAANYRLETLEHLIIVAQYDSPVGTVTSEALIAIDEPTTIVDERFNFLSAPLCSAVPITITYELLGGHVFDETLFDAEFVFTSYTVVDFTSPRQ